MKALKIITILIVIITFGLYLAIIPLFTSFYTLMVLFVLFLGRLAANPGKIIPWMLIMVSISMALIPIAVYYSTNPT